MPADEELIGSVMVAVGADYSGLQADFNAAEGLAAQAGKEVADAFVSGGAQGASFGTAVAEQLGLVGAEAGTAAAALNAWKDAADVAAAGGASLHDSVMAGAEAMREFYPEAEVSGEDLQTLVTQLLASDGAMKDTASSATDGASALEEIGGAAQTAAGDLEGFTNAADGAAASTADVSENFSEFSDAAQGVIDREQELISAVDQARSTFQELSRGFDEGTVSAGSLKIAQEDLARAERDLAESGHEAGLSMGDLVEAGLKLAGLEIGLNLLKELGTTALEVAADQEKLVMSLTALTGSAQTAAERLKIIEEISFKDALDIDTVEKVTQRMAAFGLSAEETGRALQAAADAAAATGGSFETAGTKIENMAKSGMVGNRQLLELGLSAADLGKVMGLAGDEVQAAFKDMDESQRLTVITDALTKFGGIGEQVASGLAGQWQNLKNDFHNLLESSGGDLSKLAEIALSIADGGLKTFADALKSISTTVHNVTDAVGPLITSIGEIGSAVGNLTGLLGPFKSAWDTAWGWVKDYNTYALVSGAINGMANEIQILTGKSPQIKTMNDLIGETAKQWQTTGTTSKEAAAAISASFADTHRDFSKATDEMSLYKQAVSDAAGKVSELTREYQQGKPVATELLSAQQALRTAQETYANAAEASAIAQAKHNQVLREFVSPITAAAGGMDVFSAMSEAANAKQEKLILNLGMAQADLQEAAVAFNRAAQTGKDYYQALNDLVTAQDKYDAAAKAAGVSQDQFNAAVKDAPSLAPIMDTSKQAIIDALAQLQKIVPAMEAPDKPAHTLLQDFKDLGLSVDEMSGKVTTTAISAFNDLAERGGMTTDAITMGWGKVSGAVQKLAQTDMPAAIHEYDLYISALQRSGAAEYQVQQAIESKLQAEIKYAQQTGTDATNAIIQLTNIQLAQDVAKDKATAFGDAYVAVLKTIQGGFQLLGKDIADNIVDGKSWHDVWQGFLKDIEKQILESLIGIAFKALGDIVAKTVSDLLGIGKTAIDATTKTVDAATGATKAITDTASTAASATSSAASAASSSISAVGSTVMGTIGAIGSAISAIAGVIGIFQNMQQEASLNAIEHNTRYLQIQFEQTQQAIFWPMKVNSDYLLGTVQDISTHTAGMSASEMVWLPFLGDISTHTAGLGDSLSAELALVDLASKWLPMLGDILGAVGSMAPETTTSTATAGAGANVRVALPGQHGALQPAAGNSSIINIDLSGANFSGSSVTQASVEDSMVTALRTVGARF